MQTAEVRRTKRGTPQSNCYFRRFLLAWHNHGHRDRLDAHVVNYADDFVICCRPGNAPAAMARMATLMTRLGLEVNAKKTRIARLPEESFRIFSPGIRSVASTAKTGARNQQGTGNHLGRRASRLPSGLWAVL